MMKSTKPEIDYVRDYLEASGQTVRFKPVTSLDPNEKLILIYEILSALTELKRALHVDVDRRALLTTNTALVIPTKALESLSNVLHTTFAAYHRLGLAKCAAAGFRLAHVNKLSQLGPVDEETLDFFEASLPPDYHATIKKHTAPVVFIDPEDDVPTLLS